MYGLGDSGNVCDTTSAMFDATLCNNLYVPATDSGNVCDTTSKMFNAAACNKLYVPATTPTTLTAWLNTNSTMVVIGAAAFFALMILAKGGR